MKTKSIQKDIRFESVGNDILKNLENTLENATTSYGINELNENSEIHKNRIKSLLFHNTARSNLYMTHIAEQDARHRVIIGDDDREEVLTSNYPYNCICLLEIIADSGKKYFGTGFLISKRCVITAGHCVYIDKKWVRSIKVSPGAKGNSRPFGTKKANKFRSVKGWTKRHDANFDYGAIILPDNTIYQNVQSYIGYGIINQKKIVELSGYPIDKSKTQWKSNGYIKKISPYRIYYDLDTIKGHSGSPLYYKKGLNRIVIGVHSFGQNPNYSIRLNQEIMNRWTEWVRL